MSRRPPAPRREAGPRPVTSPTRKRFRTARRLSATVSAGSSRAHPPKACSPTRRQNGQEPKVGDIFVQKDLARTLRELVGVEKKNARRGRHGALEAVRDYFYRGPLAKRYCDEIEQAGDQGRRRRVRQFRHG